MLHPLQEKVRSGQDTTAARAVADGALPDLLCLWCRQIEGSLPCAKKTLDILRLIVTNKKHSTAAALIDEIRNTGYRMQTARPVGKITPTQICVAAAGTATVIWVLVEPWPLKVWLPGCRAGHRQHGQARAAHHPRGGKERGARGGEAHCASASLSGSTAGAGEGSLVARESHTQPMLWAKSTAPVPHSARRQPRVSKPALGL